MRIDVDRKTGAPIYAQIATAIRTAVAGGELGAGEKLPSTRTLARDLGVHRNTVISAYRHLEREGLLRSGVGAGTFVAPAALPTGGETLAPAAGSFAWHRLLRDPRALEGDPGAWLARQRPALPPDAIQLTGAIADRRQFPLHDLVACADQVLRDADAGLLDYGPPEGEEGLRRWVISWLARRGVEGLEESRVFIVSGSQQGLDLIARLLLAPGDAVALEEPGYTGAFQALRQAGARLIGVPMEGEGLSLRALEERLGRTPVKFLYTMPGFQNPTGISLSRERRAHLLELARRRGLAIVEDYFDSDLAYRGPSPRPLLADDPDGQVIHLGTFSKILFPGLRVGWLVVPADLAPTVRRVRWAADLASATLTQRTMERFCRQGHLERHLARIRRINGRRLRAMLQALDDHFPDAVHWTRPRGGMTVWVELPETLDSLELFHTAAGRGVLFSPGVLFYASGGGRHALRLSFNRESEARIAAGVAVLGDLLAERLAAHTGEERGVEESMPLL